MKNEIKYVVFDKTESLAESVLKDLTTLAVVSLLVYVSQGSKWWTLVTGLMFVFWVVTKIAAVTKSRHKIFKTKAELQDWVDSVDCENVKVYTPLPAGASDETGVKPLNYEETPPTRGLVAVVWHVLLAILFCVWCVIKWPWRNANLPTSKLARTQ